MAAEGLGIKKTLPAARKFFIAPSDLKTGVCFASGGAGVDPVTSRLMVNKKITNLLPRLKIL